MQFYACSVICMEFLFLNPVFTNLWPYDSENVGARFLKICASYSSLIYLELNMDTYVVISRSSFVVGFSH